MKYPKISKRAKAFLRNKKLASTVAKALASESQSASKDGVVVTINGKNYTVKTATATAGKKIA